MVGQDDYQKSPIRWQTSNNHSYMLQKRMQPHAFIYQKTSQGSSSTTHKRTTLVLFHFLMTISSRSNTPALGSASDPLLLPNTYTSYKP